MRSTEYIVPLANEIQKELATRLRRGTADINTSHESSGSIIRVTPTNPNAAPVHVDLDPEFGAYLTIGQGAVFEVPFPNELRDRSFIDKIVDLISAVADGGFEEELILLKGTIVGATGRIPAAATLTSPVSDAWGQLNWSIFSKKERKLRKYQSYG
jgi:hypothetical protein